MTPGHIALKIFEQALQDDVVPLQFPIITPSGETISEIHIQKGDVSPILHITKCRLYRLIKDHRYVINLL